MVPRMLGNPNSLTLYYPIFRVLGKPQMLATEAASGRNIWCVTLSHSHTEAEQDTLERPTETSGDI